MKGSLFRRELSILIFEHSDGAASMNDQNLDGDSFT